MWEFKVLVFGPGLDPAGVRARVSFEGTSMVLRGRRIFLTADTSRIRLRAGGFDGRQWMLAWPTADGEVTAMLQGEQEMLQMRRYAPDELKSQLGTALRATRRRGRRFGLWLVLLALVVLLPLLLLLLFWLNADRVSGWVTNQISLETETRIGQLAFQQMQPDLNLIPDGSVPRMVRDIGGRLTSGSAYDYQWHVSASPDINAFALPGGVVVVHAGLIRAARSAEELAGVLAHEAQHVEQRHSLRNMVHGLGWRALLSVALGDVSGAVLVNLADQLGQLKYGRDLEREADLKALQSLRRAGIAPAGLASFFGQLSAREGPSLAWLSSHPESRERQQALEQAIAAQEPYATRPLPYDWPALQAQLPSPGRQD